jgi:beta-glucanase (GH16 family)
MIRMKIKIIVLFNFFSFISFSQVMWQMDKDSLITWYYQEGDEFNGQSLNKNYWSDWYGWGRSISGNKEQQYYSRWKNHYVKDGILTLTAKREDVTERYVDWMNDNDSIFDGKKFDGLNKRKFTYTAGLIQSLKDFQYGYFEIKFKIPKEGGFWPAFWLYGGTPNEEIDWMELKSNKPAHIHVGRHSQNKKYNYFPVFLGKKMVWGNWVKFKGSLNERYNVIAGEWNKNYLKYYLNGECIAISFVNLNIPKKLVANIAVSGNKGAFPPAPDKSFKDSVNFDIDYIRVWTRSESLSKRMAGNIITEEPIAGPKEIKRSSLISKSKLHYGKKSLHANEGLFASFTAQGNFKYQLCVLGKEIPKDGKYTIISSSGKTLHSDALKFGTTVLDFFKYGSSELTLIVDAFGKKATFTFTAN